MPTTKLGLPLINSNNTADVVRDFNALANAVDAKAGAADGLAQLGPDGKLIAAQINLKDASTSAKGLVQLSSSTTSTSESLAATPKAVKDVKDGLSAQIGTLSGLNTTAKDNLVNAINELFTDVGNGKTQIATAITGKGVAASGGDTFTQLATKIGQIATGKKYATGSVLTPLTQIVFTNSNNGNSNSVYITVTGLDFKPSTIIAFNPANSTQTPVLVYNKDSMFAQTGLPPQLTDAWKIQNNAYVNTGSFQLPVRNSPGANTVWHAWE